MRFGGPQYRVSTCPPTSTTLCDEIYEDLSWFKIMELLQVFRSLGTNVAVSMYSTTGGRPFLSLVFLVIGREGV